jgi:hypothetical protein
MLDEDIGERFKNEPRVEFPFDRYRKTFSRVFIDNREHAEHLAAVGAVLDEVIGPDMVRARRPKPHARSVRQTR